MAEVFGAIQRALGAVLSAIYEVIPSYGIAIVLLTVLVRVLLIPLTLKQIRSQNAMTKLAPELKKVQQKFKGDRQKMNEEVMKLYKEHGVHPLGGCFPMLLQAPVFIALYSVLRASIAVVPMTIAPVGTTAPTEFTPKELKTVVCIPAATGDYIEPRPSGPNPQEIICSTEAGKSQVFRVSDFRDIHDTRATVERASWISTCAPTENWQKTGEPEVACRSALGTGHLPASSKLFADITADRAKFLGMHLSCSASQVQSKGGARQCTRDQSHSGGGTSVPYYALIGLFIVSTYIQVKQMASRATGPQAQQQMMMARLMPVLLGFISLGIPAGVNVYWLTSNLWTIAQQAVVLSRLDQPGAEGDPEDLAKPVARPDPAPRPSGNGAKSPRPNKNKKKKGRR